MTKHEYRKHEKKLYVPKTKAQLLEVPPMKFICIKGEGNPNDEDFGNRLQVLYSIAYAIRMMPKKGITPEGYFEYTVYPLEGLWSLNEDAIENERFTKDDLIYTIMIRQPDFVDEEVFEKAVELTAEKDETGLLDEVYFDMIEDGLSVQVMHLGSYDDEPESFKIMQDFIDENNLRLKTKIHREIYLSDARKTVPEKLKTVLRYRVERTEDNK